MSAIMLRQIVAKQFNVNPRHIILSGQAKPEDTFEATIGVAYVKDCTDSLGLYSFNGKEWIDLSYAVGGTFYYNGNHDRDYKDSLPLFEVATGDEILFVTDEVGKNDNNYYRHITVFKAPSFQTHWDKIEAEDIERWENWVSETQVI